MRMLGIRIFVVLGSVERMIVTRNMIGMVWIIGMYFGIARFSRRLLLKLNRPESFLNRAIDIECSSGKVCVPDDIRGSKLYSHVIKKRTPSFQERLGVIEESGEPIPRKWKIDVPEP